MKRQIRKNVFESNSSSLHSLVIMKNDAQYTTEEIMDDIYLQNDYDTGEKNCVWEISDNDDLYFGRSPFRILSTFAEKWMYACASLVCEYNDDTYKELVSIAKKYIPNLKKIELPKTTDYIYNKGAKINTDNQYVQKYGKTKKEFLAYLEEKETLWGYEIEYWADNNNRRWCFEVPNTGRVDTNILFGFLEKENLSLEDFLTSKKYLAIQDGDEYCEYKKVKKSGLINTDNIEREYCPGAYWELEYEEDPTETTAQMYSI